MQTKKKLNNMKFAMCFNVQIHTIFLFKEKICSFKMQRTLGSLRRGRNNDRVLAE